MDLKYICTVIGNLAGIPIRLYKDKELIYYHSIVKLAVDPIDLYFDKIMDMPNKVGYYITPDFYYYGIVSSGGTTIVIGPSRQIAASENELRALAFELGVNTVDTDDFISAMTHIVQMPLDSILQIMFTMNHILNGEQLELKDVIIIDTEQERLKSVIENQNVTHNEFQPAENHSTNTYELEQTLMSMVRHGDTATLKQWLSSAPAVTPGIIANEQLRQMKNTFIVTTTLVCRNAIRGGMDVRDSLALSDSYIQKCELLNSTDAITNLQYCMVLDYTERVERIRVGKTPTKLAMDVTNYVLHHISEAIKTEDIARALFMSRSRLSTKFKEETGTNLTDYILKEKAIEAKRLLRYTTKTIISISEYLGFSSPAHFSRVFKKYIGVTPNEYRERSF